MVSVTSASCYITSASRYHQCYQSRSSKYIRGLIPWNFTGIAEAVPIGSLTFFILFCNYDNKFRCSVFHLCLIYKYQALRIYILTLSYWHTVQRIIQVCPPSVCPVIRLNLDPEIKQTTFQETWYAIRWQCADYARHFGCRRMKLWSL